MVDRGMRDLPGERKQMHQVSDSPWAQEAQQLSGVPVTSATEGVVGHQKT